MHRIRPDDHFLLLLETDATPMHIGALLLLDVPAGRQDVFNALRAHLVARLPQTPLLRVLRAAPRQYDSDVWVDVATFDHSYHIVRVAGAPAMDDAALRAFVAARSMERLDLARPPFRIFIMERLADGRAAMLIKVHHALADGVGFQTIIGMLTDSSEITTRRSRSRNGVVPPSLLWLALSWLRFRRDADTRELAVEHRAAALAALKALQAQPGNMRAKTPVLKLSGPTSGTRAFAMVSLPLPTLRATAHRLGATINDIFLAVAAGALRRYLIAIDDLPATPLVANSARSYRRPEHGPFGNRIVAMHPHLATNIADPMARLRAIQNSMAAEKRRTPYDEAMLDQPEVPFGPRDRRQKFAARVAGGGAILAGNVTLSNVPGPAEPRSLAGFPLRENYPTPLLGSSRFLNITSRRTGDALNLGIMVDPEKIIDIDRLVTMIRASFEEYVALHATGGQEMMMSA